MKPLENTLRQSVFDLIYSGVRGRMTDGDTFGIWLVSDRIDTSFPMDTWKARYNVETAAKAAAHATSRGWKSKARLDLAIADALHVVENVDDLKIILVSNGETPIAGTPFDSEINAKFRELAPQMKLANATLNTVLVAQEGELVAWAANTAEFLIEFPNVPPRKMRAPKAEVAAIKTIPARTVISTTAPVVKAVAVAEKPRVAASPIIITKDTVAQERQAFLAMTSIGASTNTAPSNIVIQKDLVTLTNPVAVAATNAAEKTIAPAMTNSVASKTATPATPPTNSPREVESRSIAMEQPRTNQAAVAPPMAATPPPAMTHSAVQPANSPWLLISLGALGALVCVLVTVVLIRSRRAEPSLISQVVAQERVRAS
jgi:hypothetical protein